MRGGRPRLALGGGLGSGGRREPLPSRYPPPPGWAAGRRGVGRGWRPARARHAGLACVTQGWVWARDVGAATSWQGRGRGVVVGGGVGNGTVRAGTRRLFTRPLSKSFLRNGARQRARPLPPPSPPFPGQEASASLYIAPPVAAAWRPSVTPQEGWQARGGHGLGSGGR